jgi:hypothetical protein
MATLPLPGQLDLPQCESKPRDQMQRAAAAPLKPSTPQEPCDVGLFSDGAAQTDLVDLCRIDICRTAR